jgi:hypothetical protein
MVAGGGGGGGGVKGVVAHGGKEKFIKKEDGVCTEQMVYTH